MPILAATERGLLGLFSLFTLLVGACGGSPSSQLVKQDAGGIVIGSFFTDGSSCITSSSSSVLDASGTDPMCDPNATQVSYARDVAPVLAGCQGDVCHAPWTRDTLVNRRSQACCDMRLLVDPNHPSSSLLTQSLTGINSCIPMMPLGGQLNTPTVQAIINWVCQGALDN